MEPAENKFQRGLTITPQLYILELYTALKGIVQRDLTGVKTRLKRSVLMNYIVAILLFEF